MHTRAIVYIYISSRVIPCISSRHYTWTNSHQLYPLTMTKTIQHDPSALSLYSITPMQKGVVLGVYKFRAYFSTKMHLIHMQSCMHVASKLLCYTKMFTASSD